MNDTYSTFEMSFSNGFPGNIDSKFKLCVIIHGVELSDTLIFINSFDDHMMRRSYDDHAKVPR